MSDDLLDLPKRPKVEVLPREEARAASSGTRLTEKQMDQVLDTGKRFVEDLGAVARELAAIHRIREQGRADVERIEAKTRHVVEKMRAEIDRLAEVRQGVRTRAQAVVEIISAMNQALQKIPDLDNDSRKALVDQLPRLVELAISDKTHGK